MQFDIVIIGGGLVGKSLALALQNLNLRIGLLESKPPQQADPRLLALNHSSCQLLHHLGLWSKIAAAAAPIRQVHVSRQGHFGAVRLKNTDVNLPTLGYVIPATHLDHILDQSLAQTNNITVHQPAQLKALSQHEQTVNLHITTADTEWQWQTHLVIGADGTHSTVRKQIQSTEEIIDYQQSAIVSRLTLQRAHQHIAYERFYPQGTIAMLPLTQQEYACIWSAEQKVIDELMALSAEDYLTRLQNEFGYRLGRFIQIKQRYQFPLRMVKASRTIQGRVMLLGNAAHTIHPVAAQGLNLSLYEAAVVAEQISQALAQNISIECIDLQNMHQYCEKQRNLSIAVSHHLSQLFSQQSPVPSFLLQAGLLGFDLVTPLKTKFMQAIMGYRNPIPHLLRTIKNNDDITTKY